MATIIVEDGSGVAGANSYNSVADLTTYAADRGITISAADPSTLLIRAMDDLESREYRGSQVYDTEWPRTGITGVEDDEIPSDIQKAQLVAAIDADSDRSSLNTPSPQVTMEKVDVITVQYSDKGLRAGYENYSPELERLLAPYLSTANGFVLRSYRG